MEQNLLLDQQIRKTLKESEDMNQKYIDGLVVYG
jgi:hypothetical protein